ncbi:hypothetical protein SAMN05192551_103133 [Tindallia magadiensis]|uniref:Uncharacterized protein n=1 Tax=Tindallia magadiensis TaxID=69895 RepID=A0A1I3D3F9_9FIRM|nr:hypothetical protein [Tindallia magadiensis]SFH81227.1 hypothetical protein SAMN05192551_103133 [Tindallia magadiensis]
MIEKDNIAYIDLKYGSENCSMSKTCTNYYEKFNKRMIGKYVGEKNVFPGQLESAVIDLKDYNYEDYYAKAKKIHKGNALRDAKKADKAGYYCKQFAWKNHIPDIVEINQSKEVRSGGVMRDAYNRSVDEMGGDPEKYRQVKEPDCNLHTTYNWGIFERIPGYMQGNIETNEKLLAYVKFKRNGNLATYTSILGHGDYLKEGIMYNLHLSIMQWVQELTLEKDPLEYILYGAIDSGNEGLQQWKKRMLFVEKFLLLSREK